LTFSIICSWTFQPPPFCQNCSATTWQEWYGVCLACCHIFFTFPRFPQPSFRHRYWWPWSSSCTNPRTSQCSPRLERGDLFMVVALFLDLIRVIVGLNGLTIPA
jgi:hypothetical protein